MTINLLVEGIEHKFDVFKISNRCVILKNSDGTFYISHKNFNKAVIDRITIDFSLQKTNDTNRYFLGTMFFKF